jgi:large subunit ribosomal protein L6
MSRIGKKPIVIHPKVKVNLINDRAEFEGPAGKVKVSLPIGITCRVEAGSLIVERRDETKPQKSLHGLARQLLSNAAMGVEKGFKKELDIVGVGYKAAAEGKKVTFNIGYSHPIELIVPDGIKVTVEKATHIVVEGADKELVGQISATIRHYKKPDPYKGKGIMFTGEKIIRKAGKAAK